MNDTISNIKIFPRIDEEPHDKSKLDLRKHSNHQLTKMARKYESLEIGSRKKELFIVENVNTERVSKSVAAPMPTGSNFILKFNKQNEKSIKKIK